MSDNKCNDPKCGCQASAAVDAGYKHRQSSERRQFLKNVGIMGVGLGLAPALTYWLQDKSDVREIVKNPAVLNGKARHITILHTSDIHGQLDIHDEFFWENGKP